MLNSNKVLDRSPVYKIRQTELPRGSDGRGSRTHFCSIALDTTAPPPPWGLIKYSLRTAGHSDFQLYY